MKNKAIILTLLMAIAIYPSQSITISGVVKTSGGNGLEGVKVRLGKAALTATTASDGSFTLNDGTGLKHDLYRNAFRNDCSFRCKDNTLIFSSPEQAEVIVTAYDCNGRLLFSRGKAIIRGDYSITLPNSGSGIRIIRVSVNHKLYGFKNIAGIGADRGAAASTGEFGLAKRSSATERIDDALLFIKQGYQYSRIPVTKPDTSGVQVTLAPLDTGTLTDADGNVYKTVRIGNQYWMAENLRTTKYNDGSGIGSACRFYNNATDAAAKKKWGALYKLNAITSGKLAPTGWHIPSNAEWDTLTNYLITHGYNYDGTTSGNKIAKSMAAASDWQASSEIGAIGNELSLNNASGFSALPAGRWYWGTNNFTAQGSEGYWYTSTPGNQSVGYDYGWICSLWWINFDLSRWDAASVDCSVRLVKNK